MSSFAKTSSLKDNIGVTPIESANTASLWKPSKGFLRPQVFCLQHALEVKEQLQPMGVHICCFYVTQVRLQPCIFTHLYFVLLLVRRVLFVS